MATPDVLSLLTQHDFKSVVLFGIEVSSIIIRNDVGMSPLMTRALVTRLCITIDAGSPGEGVRRARARRRRVELQRRGGPIRARAHAPGRCADHDERECAVSTARYVSDIEEPEYIGWMMTRYAVSYPADSQKPNFKMFSNAIKEEKEKTKLSVETLLQSRSLL